MGEIDTAVRAVFRDGTEKDYACIGEASADTGLSVAAIKIRCNKPGAKGRDGISFRWLDDTTARRYRSRKSRSHGKALEREIVGRLKGIGYPDVCRSAAESRRLDNDKVDIADPSGQLEVAIQAKHQAVFPNYFRIREECPDERELVLIWKKTAKGGQRSPGTLAVMDAGLFYKLLEKYHK